MARMPAWGAGGRRFESCLPDLKHIMANTIDSPHKPEISQDGEKERIARLPYLFRGISISKFLYSLSHPEGIPRPAAKEHFWGQWAESLGTACSYAFSAQHELDRSYGNTQYPGLVLIAKKTQLSDFSEWKHHDGFGKYQPSDFRQYDSGRNPQLSDAKIVFISEEHYGQIDVAERKKIPGEVHTYPGAEVNWYDQHLRMGDIYMVSSIRAAMLEIDPDFSPPLVETSSADDDKFGQLELTLFDFIKTFSHQQIIAAYNRCASIITIAFNPDDQRDQQKILQQTEQLLQTLPKPPFATDSLKIMVGIAYFLAQEPRSSSNF